jgi:hypothetical protein
VTVTEISYSRLVSFGSYENASFAATVQVGVGEDLDEAAAALKAFVEHEAEAVRQDKERWRKTRCDLEQAEYALAGVKGEEQALREKCERMTKFLHDHGVTDVVDPSVPF